MKKGRAIIISVLAVLFAGLLSCGSSDSDAVAEGQACGGEQNIQCAGGLFCKYETGVCAENSAQGVCSSIPEMCIELFSPVCGCDGKTYSNSCKAFAAGSSVRSEGECSL